MKSRTVIGIVSSICPMSLENRFMIRPIGFISKNRIGVINTRSNMFRCRFREDLAESTKKRNTRMHATPNADPISTFKWPFKRPILYAIIVKELIITAINRVVVGPVFEYFYISWVIQFKPFFVSRSVQLNNHVLFLNTCPLLNRLDVFIRCDILNWELATRLRPNSRLRLLGIERLWKWWS